MQNEPCYLAVLLQRLKRFLLTKEYRESIPRYHRRRKKTQEFFLASLYEYVLVTFLLPMNPSVQCSESDGISVLDGISVRIRVRYESVFVF